MKKYKCMNIGNCDNANNNVIFEIAEGEELKCPNPKCQSEMIVEVKKSPILMYIIIAAAVALLCGGGFGVWKMIGDGGPKIDKVELTPNQIALVIDETPKAQLNAKALDEEGQVMTDEDIAFEWTIDNESVASITADGEVTAVGEGNAIVTVKIKGKEVFATCPVEVKVKETPVVNRVLIEELSLVESENFTLKQGESKKLQYKATPEDNEETPVWKSSDSTIVSVDAATGEAKALKDGKAKISIESQKASASVEVTVLKKDSIQLSWGRYDGPRNSSGNPDGFGGTITVTKSYTIDLKKASGETVTVSPGDKIFSVKMENGRLRQGEIHFADGKRKYISGL